MRASFHDEEEFAPLATHFLSACGLCGGAAATSNAKPAAKQGSQPTASRSHAPWAVNRGSAAPKPNTGGSTRHANVWVLLDSIVLLKTWPALVNLSFAVALTAARVKVSFKDSVAAWRRLDASAAAYAARSFSQRAEIKDDDVVGVVVTSLFGKRAGGVVASSVALDSKRRKCRARVARSSSGRGAPKPKESVEAE